ncbi:ribokinase [Streptomyces sp. RKND-216]|uniref:ribokinase n=1 Tax=Streptomyces sp. RKND-216 TaxID=2562581 RepID=UPI001B345A47|nr:ribokinase [Streptomyces sp. RKND-216]
MGSVTVLGSLNVDLVTSVPRLPGRGETVAGGRLHRLPGGKGANQAVACARAGATVRMVGAVGADEGGDLLLRALAREGVDTTAVRRRADVATGTATILVEDGGENMIAVTTGANGHLGDEDTAAACDRLGPGDVLLLQCEVPLGVVRRAGRRAAARGATVVLNAAPAPPPDALGLPLPELDVLLVNEHEARLLASAGTATGTGGEPGAESAEDAARALAARNGCLVVATLGARGALAMRGGASEVFPAPRVDATDTVGAGDAFAGYLAAALARGADPRAAITTAVLAASLAVTRSGAQEAMPRHDEIRSIRNTRSPEGA